MQLACLKPHLLHPNSCNEDEKSQISTALILEWIPQFVASRRIFVWESYLSHRHRCFDQAMSLLCNPFQPAPSLRQRCFLPGDFALPPLLSAQCNKCTFHCTHRWRLPKHKRYFDGEVLSSPPLYEMLLLQLPGFHWQHLPKDQRYGLRIAVIGSNDWSADWVVVRFQCKHAKNLCTGDWQSTLHWKRKDDCFLLTGPMTRSISGMRRRSDCPSCWATQPATMMVTSSPALLRLACGPR